MKAVAQSNYISDIFGYLREPKPAMRAIYSEIMALVIIDSNYNLAATRQNLPLVSQTTLDSNQFPLTRKLKAVAQSNYLSDIYGYLRELKPVIRAIYSEIVALIIILWVIPLTDASVKEHSVLCRMKMYLRRTMTQSGINKCITLHVHKERTDARVHCKKRTTNVRAWKVLISVV